MYYGISNINLRKTTSMDDVILYDKNNEYRASYEARYLGELEYNRDHNKRKRETSQYCNSINKSYENALRFNY